MIVSIHQPNYIPWIGFFHKLLLSNTYVIFDDVQFPRGKDYANINQIKTNNGKMWLTASVLGKKDLKPWNQIEINNNGWKEKHLKNIKSFYQKAPYFERYYPVLEKIYEQDHKLLIDLNIDLIIGLLKSIDDNTKTFKEDDDFYLESDHPISIPKDVYRKFCKELDLEGITFMGIT